MTSDAEQERVAIAWAASIPERFRYSDKDHTGVNASYGAAIAAPPPSKKQAAGTLLVQYRIDGKNIFFIDKVEVQRGDKRVRLIA
jgi:hypothetical protein